MKEGEPVLGGPQANPSGMNASNFGDQPPASSTPQPPQTSIQSTAPTPPIAQAQPTPPPQAIPQTPAQQNQYIDQSPAYPVSQPISSNTGDVVLTGSKPKKAKRVGITVLIIIATLGVIGGFVYYIISNNNFGVGNFNLDVKASFNRYANYLLHQADSDSDIPENSWTNSTINNNLFKDDTDNYYFSRLLELYNNFFDNFQNSSQQDAGDEEDPDLIYGLVNNNNEALQALAIYVDITKVSIDDMAAIYLEQGGDTMIDYVNNIYNKLLQSTNQDIHEYGAAKIEASKLVNNIYDEYGSLGCINKQELDQACVESATFSENYNENQRLLEEYASELEDVERHITNDVISLSHMIYDILNSGESNNG